jgi:hypothetical protein
MPAPLKKLKQTRRLKIQIIILKSDWPVFGYDWLTKNNMGGND